MTNFEKIKDMSAEEMAEWISQVFKAANFLSRVEREYCICFSLDNWLKKWLKSEADDE